MMMEHSDTLSARSKLAKRLECLGRQNLSLIQIALKVEPDVITQANWSSYIEGLYQLLETARRCFDDIYSEVNNIDELENLYSDLDSIHDIAHVGRCGGIQRSEPQVIFDFFQALQTLIQHWFEQFHNWKQAFCVE